MLKFLKISTALGSKIESNDDIAGKVGWSSEEILNKTGINQRFISNEIETTEELALKSYKKIEENQNTKDVDLIISVSNTPSILFPSIGHYVYQSSEITDAKIIGLNAGCTGYLDCLSIAIDMFENNRSEKALILTADTYSKHIPISERSTRTLFSDGASATLIKKSKNGFKRKKEVNTSLKGTFDKLLMKSNNHIEMDGPGVLHFGISKVIKEINSLIDKEDSLDIFPHQAGKIMLETLQKKIKGNHIFHQNYENFGNLVSTSIPNLLEHKFDVLNASTKFLLSGFGVGLSHHSILFNK